MNNNFEKKTLPLSIGSYCSVSSGLTWGMTVAGILSLVTTTWVWPAEGGRESKRERESEQEQERACTRARARARERERERERERQDKVSIAHPHTTSRSYCISSNKRRIWINTGSRLNAGCLTAGGSAQRAGRCTAANELRRSTVPSK